MRFSKKIRVEDDDSVMNIHLKVNTNGKSLTREESVREFNYRLNDIIKALMRNHHYDDIKVRG